MPQKHKRIIIILQKSHANYSSIIVTRNSLIVSALIGHQHHQQ